MKRGRADVIQPDLSHMGGLLEGARLAATAEAFGTRVAPHTGNSPIITAASLHLDGCTPNALIQETFDDYDHPTLRRDLFGELPRLVDGQLPLPNRPGLGIEFDEAACAAFQASPDRARRTGVLFAKDWPQACWEDNWPHSGSELQ